MTEKFLALAQTGKNQWWRYLLSILLILVLWQGSGLIIGIFLWLFIEADGNPETRINPETLQFEGIDPLLFYLAINLSFVFFLIGLYLAVRFIHQRRFITLISPKNKINWNRILQGFVAFSLLLIVFSVIEGISNSENYQLTFSPGKFFLFLPIALIFTSLQTSVEEFFFRGYLMQGMALITRKSIIPIVVTSLLFMLPHLLNPELKSGFFLLAAYYFVFGLFLAWITVKDNTLELALAAHASNNLYVALLVNFAGGALPSHSVFTIQELNPISNLVISLIIFALFYWFFFRKKKREMPSS